MDDILKHDNLSEILIGLFLFVVYVIKRIREYIKKKRNARRHDPRNVFEMNHELDKRVESIRTDLKADRVSVYQFHNGVETVAHIPFIKMTMTNEATAPAIKGFMDVSQGLPTARFTDFFMSLLKEGYMHIDLSKRKADGNDHPFEFLLTYRQIKSAVVVLLYDFYSSEKTPIGIMKIAYNNHVSSLTPENAEKLKNKIKIYGTEISQFIMENKFLNGK